MRKVIPIFTFLFTLLFAASSIALAADCCAKLTSDSYAERAPMRLLHGISNIVSSPVLLVMEPYHAVATDNQNILNGLAKGFVYGGKFLVLGAWDVVTFWVPGSTGKEIATQDCGWMRAFRLNCQKPAAQK